MLCGNFWLRHVKADGNYVGSAGHKDNPQLVFVSGAAVESVPAVAYRYGYVAQRGGGAAKAYSECCVFANLRLSLDDAASRFAGAGAVWTGIAGTKCLSPQD